MVIVRSNIKSIFVDPLVSGILLFSQIGEKNGVGTTERRKIRQCNIITLVALLSATCYGLFYLIAGENIIFTRAATSQFSCIPFFLLTPILNFYSRFALRGGQLV